MSNGDDERKLSPISIRQNPYPAKETGQQFEKAVRAQVENILAEFKRLLPSNYVSYMTGPYYMVQFQAVAEILSRFQVVAQEVYEDTDYDFTRPEFLWEILCSYVFPRGTTEGIPEIPGDISYRDFLKSMVLLLLRGAKPDVVQEGIELLTDADIEIIEKSLHIDNPISAWTRQNQYEFEINVSVDGGTDFPDEPFVLMENVRLVLDALKPAHALYEYRHLFRESFEDTIDDEPSWNISSYYYEDWRRFCAGTKEIVSSFGETLTNRRFFRDLTVEFDKILEGALLTMTSGPNEGKTYRVEQVIVLPYGTDSTPRAYTTSPTGLTGYLTVSGTDFEDTSQDFSAASEGEILTITDGPNAGSYRLKTLLGNDGGPLGKAPGPATRVRPAANLLYLSRRMDYSSTGQGYTLVVERLGVQVPRTVTGEDVSAYFYL